MGDPSGKAEYALADGGRGRALHVKIGHLGGWDTLASPVFQRPFPTNHTLTCFRAKGGPRTRQLSLEWDERNGSRWIATVDLTPQWKDYALVPDRFKAWPTPATGGLHRPFNPEKAVSCSVGLALSHTAVEGSEHEYWFDDLGTAENPMGDAALPSELDIPALESISPTTSATPSQRPWWFGRTA